MRCKRGFTLIETLVVVTIAGVLLAFGMPAFLDYREALRQKSARAQVSEDLYIARQLAVTRHAPVIVAFGTPPATTNITSYTIHVDTNGDGLVQSGERRFARALPTNVKLSQVSLTPTDSLIFDATGILYPGTSGGSLVIAGRGRADTLLVSAAGAVYQR